MDKKRKSDGPKGRKSSGSKPNRQGKPSAGKSRRSDDRNYDGPRWEMDDKGKSKPSRKPQAGKDKPARDEKAKPFKAAKDKPTRGDKDRPSKPGKDKPARTGEKPKFNHPELKKGVTRTGRPKKKKAPMPTFSEDVRLNKYLANAGICSRREADVLISTGVITVNGEVVTEMGFKVKPEDVVRYDGDKVTTESKRYFLLNKPKDFSAAPDDPVGSRTVMQLVKNACKERIIPVGRMDRNALGLLLVTNDGDLIKKLTHPKYGVRQIYHVETSKPLTEEQVNKLRQGVEIDGGAFVKPEKVDWVKDSKKKELGIETNSVKNRVVQRMMEALGHNVVKVDRVTYGGLTKINLPRGKFRELTEEEVRYLKMI